MRQYLTTIFLVCTLMLGELHTYWAGKTNIQNWILVEYKPMNITWNIKFAVSELVIILYFAAWLLWKPNRINKTTVKAFFWLAILDAALYFYNYKLGGFGNIYFWFAGFWLIAYKWNYLKQMAIMIRHQIYFK